MKKNSRSLFLYDAESDVLSWELNSRPIRYAKEAGNVILHFGDGNALVLVEILEATKLLSNAIGILEKGGVSIPRPLPSFSVTQADSSR